jgi:hypothetical protein
MKGKIANGKKPDASGDHNGVLGSKSLVRVRWYGYTIIAVVGMFVVAYSTQFSVLYWLGFAIGAIFCILLFSVRCENCGNLAYRLKSRTYGFPHPLCHLQPRRCPLCGVERY